jgi:hypothetical protein
MGEIPPQRAVHLHQRCLQLLHSSYRKNHPTCILMSVKLTLKIGRTPVLIEGNTLKECFEETELICQLPQCCGNCKSDNLLPSYSRTGDYEFYFLRCGDCQHELKFGQRKSDKGLFPKFDEGQDGWVEPFKGGRRPEPEDRPTRSTQRSAPPPSAYTEDDDDIPF